MASHALKHLVDSKQCHSLCSPNMPFPSCCEPHYESEAKCKGFVRELKQRRRQRQQKRHLKIYLYFICATSRSFKLAQRLQKCELSRNQIGRSGVQVKKENEKFTVMRSRSPQNLKACRTLEERAEQTASRGD